MNRTHPEEQDLKNKKKANRVFVFLLRKVHITTTCTSKKACNIPQWCISPPPFFLFLFAQSEKEKRSKQAPIVEGDFFFLRGRAFFFLLLLRESESCSGRDGAFLRRGGNT